MTSFGNNSDVFEVCGLKVFFSRFKNPFESSILSKRQANFLAYVISYPP